MLPKIRIDHSMMAALRSRYHDWVQDRPLCVNCSDGGMLIIRASKWIGRERLQGGLQLQHIKAYTV